MYRIQKTVTFAASHQLTKFPPDHKCHRPHGHNYRVDLEFESEFLDQCGVVMDFSTPTALIREMFDHRNLNDIAAFDGNPTAELLAQFIYDLIDRELLWPLNRDVGKAEKIRTTRVRVWENDSCWAEYTPQPVAET